MTTAVEHRPRVLQPGMILLGSLGLALLGWGVAISPLFATRSIEVRGIQRLQADEIRQLAGVRAGTNLFRVSLDDVTASLEREPWIADATAARSLPSTLMITVAERRPVGWLKDAEGPVVIAADGVIVDRPGSPPRAIPWLGRSPSALTPGARLATAPVALNVARSLGDSVLLEVRTVTVGGQEVVLLLRGGGEVLYGPPERLQEKSRAIDSMLRWADQQGVEVASIDVRIPGSPTLLPVS
jgi:cell division protein FtsQ